MVPPKNKRDPSDRPGICDRRQRLRNLRSPILRVRTVRELNHILREYPHLPELSIIVSNSDLPIISRQRPPQGAGLSSRETSEPSQTTANSSVSSTPDSSTPEPLIETDIPDSRHIALPPVESNAEIIAGDVNNPTESFPQLIPEVIATPSDIISPEELLNDLDELLTTPPPSSTYPSVPSENLTPIIDFLQPPFEFPGPVHAPYNNVLNFNTLADSQEIETVQNEGRAESNDLNQLPSDQNN